MAEQPIRIDPGEEPPGIDGASGEAARAGARAGVGVSDPDGAVFGVSLKA